MLFSLTPRLDYDETEDFPISLESGYFKTKFRNLEVQLGKDAMFWGPGKWGNLSLTNNSRPLTGIKLSNIDPIPLQGIFKVLNRLDATFFYSELEKERSDVNDPSFVGLRISARPTANFTIAGSFNSIVGGEGRALSSSDYGKLIIGKNATKDSDEKWDTIAGLDLRWRLPKLHGIQVYSALYGEDQAGEIIPFPSRNAYLAGIYWPRLSSDGAWDLQLEAARTLDCWYSYHLYTNGYVYHDHIIGDAMGSNADRYSAGLSHYFPDGTQLTFFLEHLVQDRDAANPQTVNSVTVTLQKELKEGWGLTGTVGVADIDHPDYQADLDDHNYLLSLSLRKEF